MSMTSSMRPGFVVQRRPSCTYMVRTTKPLPSNHDPPVNSYVGPRRLRLYRTSEEDQRQAGNDAPPLRLTLLACGRGHRYGLGLFGARHGWLSHWRRSNTWNSNDGALPFCSALE